MKVTATGTEFSSPAHQYSFSTVHGPTQNRYAHWLPMHLAIYGGRQPAKEVVAYKPCARWGPLSITGLLPIPLVIYRALSM